VCFEIKTQGKFLNTPTFVNKIRDIDCIKYIISAHICELTSCFKVDNTKTKFRVINLNIFRIQNWKFWENSKKKEN
jgi:hypothetical protein